MFGNAVEISLIFSRILGPLVLGWAPNHFDLGAQLARGKKRLVCIPVITLTGGLVFRVLRRNILLLVKANNRPIPEKKKKLISKFDEEKMYTQVITCNCII